MDYRDTAEFARQMIREFGAPVEIEIKTSSPNTWGGKQSTNSVQATAVQVPATGAWGESIATADMLARCTVVWLVEPSQDIQGASHVSQAGKRYSIKWVSTLAPDGVTNVLHAIGGALA